MGDLVVAHGGRQSRTHVGRQKYFIQSIQFAILRIRSICRVNLFRQLGTVPAEHDEDLRSRSCPIDQPLEAGNDIRSCRSLAWLSGPAEQNAYVVTFKTELRLQQSGEHRNVIGWPPEFGSAGAKRVACTADQQGQ